MGSPFELEERQRFFEMQKIPKQARQAARSYRRLPEEAFRTRSPLFPAVRMVCRSRALDKRYNFSVVDTSSSITNGGHNLRKRRPLSLSLQRQRVFDQLLCIDFGFDALSLSTGLKPCRGLFGEPSELICDGTSHLLILPSDSRQVKHLACSRCSISESRYKP